MTPSETPVAGSVASGVSGALLALGIPGELLIWGVIGSIFGLSWAPESGRVRAIFLFVASSLFSSKLSVIIVASCFDGRSDIAGAVACGLGAVMHPFLAAVVDNIPAYVARRAQK